MRNFYPHKKQCSFWFRSDLLPVYSVRCVCLWVSWAWELTGKTSPETCQKFNSQLGHLSLKPTSNMQRSRKAPSNMTPQLSVISPVAPFEMVRQIQCYLSSFDTNIAIFRQIDMEFWSTNSLWCKFVMSVHPLNMVSFGKCFEKK